MSERVTVFCFMDTDRATLDDLAILRVAFEDGTPLGWEAGLDGPLLENLTAGSSVAKFYWLIPISVSEVAFKKQNGVEVLEQRFEDSGFDYLNPQRESVV